jgi:hypothetical protein
MTRRTACAAAASLLAAAVFSSVSYASCIGMTPAQQRARADVVFDGIALSGPTPTGIQRFRVTRYLKGRGPQIVRVSTGNIRRADGSGTVSSVSLEIKRGERWRIFARGNPRLVLRSNLCDGSRKR